MHTSFALAPSLEYRIVLQCIRNSPGSDVVSRENILHQIWSVTYRKRIGCVFAIRYMQITYVGHPSFRASCSLALLMCFNLNTNSEKYVDTT